LTKPGQIAPAIVLSSTKFMMNRRLDGRSIRISPVSRLRQWRTATKKPGCNQPGLFNAEAYAR